jgi:hypothetical protein
MDEIFRNSLEKRRKRLIDKLIAFDVYKKEDKHLFKLSLTELEYEYRRFIIENHPHSDIGSIRINNHNQKKN